MKITFIPTPALCQVPSTFAKVSGICHSRKPLPCLVEPFRPSVQQQLWSWPDSAVICCSWLIIPLRASRGVCALPGTHCTGDIRSKKDRCDIKSLMWLNMSRPNVFVLYTWLLIYQFYKASVIQLYVYLTFCCLSTSMQISLVKPLTVFPPTSNLSVLQSVKSLYHVTLVKMRCFSGKMTVQLNHHKMHRTSIVNKTWW